MIFDPKYAAEVLLPLSNAAYHLPLKVGTLPADYEFRAPIEIDGSKVEWELSRIKINRRDILRNLLAQNQFGWVTYDPKTGTIVVAYRGTNSIYDILRDFEFDSEPYQCVPSYGMVHAGFQHIYFAIRDSVIESIKDLPMAKHCVLTGHSLGGALAVLSAPDLLYQHILSETPVVINFAGPRAGHQDFSDKFNADITTCFRVVNKWDIIPMTPPLHSGYSHVGKEIEIDGGKTLVAVHAHSLEDSYIPGLNDLVKLAGE